MVGMDWRDKQDEPKVHEIRTLGLERDAEAKQTLTEVARQVQPIMRKRNWVVPLLSEVKPGNPNLLGLNVGGGGGRTKEVKVRLRPHHAPNDFYPREHVLGTMLHELCHNVRGPHDSVFYKLLDEITEECEELMAKGITGTGQGFDAPSAGRLGAHGFIPTHNPPVSSMRAIAAKAAEERAKRQRIMPQGPCKLGGARGTDWRSLTPAEAAARAAMRRAADDVWCPCSQLGGLNLGGSEQTAAGGPMHTSTAGQQQAAVPSGAGKAGAAGGQAGSSGSGAAAGVSKVREGGPGPSGRDTARANGVVQPAGAGNAAVAAVAAAAAHTGARPVQGTGRMATVSGSAVGAPRISVGTQPAANAVAGPGAVPAPQVQKVNGPRIVIDLTLSDDEDAGGRGSGGGPAPQGVCDGAGAQQHAVQAVNADESSHPSGYGAAGSDAGRDVGGGAADSRGFVLGARGVPASGPAADGSGGLACAAEGLRLPADSGRGAFWVCSMCTFENVEGVGECEMCATPWH